MQRKVVSRVDVIFYIFTLVNYMLLSQLFKKSVMLICFLCGRLQLNLIIHTVCWCDVTKSICAVSILHLWIVCTLL